MNAKTYLAKNANRIPAAAVFVAAAIQSFGHTVEVANRYGEASSAFLMPVAIDGLMITAASYVSHGRNRIAKVAAAVVFGIAALVMLWMNYLAADPNPVSRGVAMIPAVSMILTGALMHWAPQKTAVKRRPAVRRKPASNVRPIRAAKTATA